MPLWPKLQKKLTYLKTPEIEIIHKAFLLAERAHASQKRASGEPYITHPLSVALLLAEMRLDHESIAASILHDVVEDTDTNHAAIVSAFGNVIADLVDGVTKLSKMEFLNHAEIQAESFRKTVLAMSRDIRVILIKLADRFHNMQTIQGLPAEKRSRIALETIDIYAPIANRLGMHKLSAELSDLGLAAFHPWRYKILSKALEEMRCDRQKNLVTIEKKLQEALKKQGIEVHAIFGREKHLFALYQRMVRRHIDFKQANNEFSLRIVVKDIDACYRTLGVLHSIYKPLPGKFKDYIAIPKFNGYQSLHTILFGPQGMPMEIQIRDEHMDHLANYGIVTQWLYHADDASPDDPQKRAQKWIMSLLEIQQNTGGSLEFIENVKHDLFPDDVYVFTPKGRIIELPRKATVIDFAYAIHNDIGNTCVSAKLNNDFVPFSAILKTGDTVTILTSPEARPNPVWLDFVVTGRAKSGIHNFLKSQHRQEAISLGKELLSKALRDLSANLTELEESKIKEFLLNEKLQALDDLFFEIGLGHRFATFVAHQLLGNLDAATDAAGHSISTLLIKGAEGMAINFADCCHPIPGDSIVGLLQKGHGLILHRAECPVFLRHKKHPGQQLAVAWMQKLEGNFIAAIEAEVTNQKGSLARLTQEIANAESNIEDIKTTELGAQYMNVALKIQVKNLIHLERVIRHLNSLPVVISAKRTNHFAR